jgi:hypothetical protein
VAYKIAVVFETVNPKVRDAIIEQLGELAEEHHVQGGVITLRREIKQGRSVKTTTHKITLLPGETFDPNELAFGDETPLDRALAEVRLRNGEQP